VLTFASVRSCAIVIAAAKGVFIELVELVVGKDRDVYYLLSLAPIVCSELWPVHKNTKIDKSSRLQVGVPGWLRTGHRSEHIIIGARDST
jgi:hypothetical protein